MDATDSTTNSPLVRSSFPSSFVFGVATSAYQIEGAYREGGKGESIWDAFCHTPGNILNDDNGDVACDHYNRFEEDVELLHGIGMKAYRFSIAWTRIFPTGLESEPNEEGIDFYNRLIDKLLQKGITPYVTLYHWDLPLKLHTEFGGWLSDKIILYFVRYASVCFARFSDRVRNWITFNEPQCLSLMGYAWGMHAPGRGKKEGNSATEPYIVAHNIIRAHSAAVSAFRDSKYLGRVGLSLDVEWADPYDPQSEKDREASERRMIFQLGWFLHPLLYGDYPLEMKAFIPVHRLPAFSPGDVQLMKGAIDFIGINHYTSKWVRDRAHERTTRGTQGEQDDAGMDHVKDQWVDILAQRDGVPIGERAAFDWLYVVPWGIERVLLWIHDHYSREFQLPMLITENGMDDFDDGSQTREPELLNDSKRVAFYNSYLTHVARAMRKGVNVEAYFAWSFLDNFEWAVGYAHRFGIVHVGFKEKEGRGEEEGEDTRGLKRTLKLSALWWKDFLSQSQA